MKRYTLEVTEEQLIAMNVALEEFFRLRLGQFFDFVSDLAFIGFSYGAEDNTFDMRIRNKDDAEEQFRLAYNTATAVEQRKEQGGYWTNESKICCDLYQVIRKCLWDNKEIEKLDDWCVDSQKPLLKSDEPLAVCRRKRGGDKL